MTFRTRFAVPVVLAVLVLVPLGNTTESASAAPLTPHTVLDTMCGFHSAGKPCAVLVQRESGAEVLKVRDRAGHIHRFTSSTAALRYLDHRVQPCPEEDSAHCLWDAAGRGNDVGDTFIVIGGHAEGTGTVVYLGDLD